MQENRRKDKKTEGNISKTAEKSREATDGITGQKGSRRQQKTAEGSRRQQKAAEASRIQQKSADQERAVSRSQQAQTDPARGGNSVSALCSRSKRSSASAAEASAARASAPGRGRGQEIVSNSHKNKQGG